jgi:S1-C subfamily serine protease
MAATPSADIGERVRKAVVKVYASAQAPNEGEPWQAGSVSSSTGSGCVLPGHRILTAAHVVARQTYLQVRRHGETKKHDARVLFVAHDVDLALLTVDEAAFFDGIEPLDLGPLPPIQASVVALGFPTGGDTLSLTNGVVSRIEHQYYAHSGGTFLAMQIDAAVNPGNSGGPVIESQRLVGMAMQTLSDAQSISYVVPSPVVERFLADVADGTYEGVPALGVSTQPLENRAMRKRYGVEGEKGGVLLRVVVPGTGAATTLRAGDVLLSIDGTLIAEDGTVEFRPGERTSFAHLVDRKQRGSEVDVAFVRDGRRQQARIPLTGRYGQGRLVPVDDYETDPRYFVFGGVVLRPLTLPYICSFGSEWWHNAPDEFLAARPKTSTFEGEGLVAMTNVFPDEVNQGYQDFRNVLVTAIDGVRPRNFLHAVELVENGEGEFLTLSLADTNTVVLNRAAAKSRHAAILERYHVPFDRSANLRTAEPKVAVTSGRSANRPRALPAPAEEMLRRLGLERRR